MIGLRATVGKPGVDRATAEQVGELQHAVVDVASGRVAKLVVGHGRHHALVDWSDVTSLGPDAVIVTSSREPTSDEDRDVSGAHDPLDKRVLSDEGNELGQVLDVDVDDDGRIHELTITDETVPADRLRGVGSYAVVVAHAAS